MAEPRKQDGAFPADREIVTTQTFEAPRERVFAAWTDPDQVARWWGPRGFRNSIQTFEPRPGGQWNFIMQGPDGTRFENENVFVEVHEPERIVFDPVSTPPFRVIVSLAEDGSGTRLSFCMRFGTAAECDVVRGFAQEGNEQTFLRLAALLADG
jgi:uncharacterized protein YndB with AHSA1/START domain